ncbi:MAG: alkaline phosphatase family protein, partial [Sedimentisphaerales bacterium]|nr:alkaline phosphatase family protein [Sedimentisphaerales bacterium]
MSSRKILIIGLDSATWLTLDPLLERGLMPHLKALRDGGCSGILRSTNPPITSSGWTAMLSGVHPARHGIVGFERYDFANNRLCFARSQDVRVETIWQVLSRRGHRVAALNVPMHYPPYPVNGVMTSGYGCPGMAAEVTFPAALKDLIRRQIPDYNILVQWNVDEKDPDAFDQVVRACQRSFEHTYELAQLVTDRYGWDVMMVVSHQMDLMQHKLMGYLLPDGWEKWPRQAERMFDLFGRLDAILAKLAALASGSDDLVMITSDHGQGPRYGRVRPNSILRQWGYLRQQSGLGRACRRLAEPIGSLFGRRRRRGTKRIFTAGPLDVVEMLRLDWPRTRALA